jgi:hypothetical protein
VIVAAVGDGEVGGDVVVEVVEAGSGGGIEEDEGGEVGEDAAQEALIGRNSGRSAS